MGWGEAILDAFYAETLSITVMEVVAIGADLYLAGDATISEPSSRSRGTTRMTPPVR